MVRVDVDLPFLENDGGVEPRIDGFGVVAWVGKQLAAVDGKRGEHEGIVVELFVGSVLVNENGSRAFVISG